MELTTTKNSSRKLQVHCFIWVNLGSVSMTHSILIQSSVWTEFISFFINRWLQLQLLLVNWDMTWDSFSLSYTQTTGTRVQSLYQPHNSINLTRNIYRVDYRTWPSIFNAKLRAPRMFPVPQLMYHLILLGLRILKWGETFLWSNFDLICGSLKEAGEILNAWL